MINFSIAVINPFSTRHQLLRTFTTKCTNNIISTVSLSKTNDFLTFEICCRTNGNHNGFSITLGFVGYAAELEVFSRNHKVT